MNDGGSIDLGGINNSCYWHDTPFVRLCDTLMLLILNSGLSEDPQDIY